MNPENKEEMKKFQQGFGYKFEVDSDRLMEWIQDLNSIRTHIRDNNLFTAGFSLSELMGKIISCHTQLQKTENKYDQ